MNILTNIPALPIDFLALLTGFFPAKYLLNAPKDCWIYGYDNSRRHVLPRYDTPRENPLGLRAVTGADKEIRVGTHTSKSVVGYDL